LLYFTGIGLVLLVAAYFIAGALVRKKLDVTLRQLPPSLTVTYSTLDVGLLSGSLVIHGLAVRFAPGADTSHQHRMVIGRIAVEGIGFWTLITAKKLKIGDLRVEGGTIELDQYLLEKDPPFPKVELPFKRAFIGRLDWKGVRVEAFKGERKTGFFRGGGELDSVVMAGLASTGRGGDGLDSGVADFASMRLTAEEIRYVIPGADETVHLSRLELDSKKRRLRVDTLRILPAIDKLEIGRSKGHQVDVVEARIEGLRVEGLEVMALLKHRLIADEISVRQNNIYVFRDRRLPLEEGKKPMPAEYLKSLPVPVRVRLVKIGTTSFVYEEFPKKGNRPGTLKIVRLKGTISPLINHPVEGDPAYITIRTEGSLMGSGLVDATTRVPLHKGDPYVVQGAFHELDVTSLNPSAENLGKIHLESGVLNTLAFWFRMDDEKATGKIVGEYHNLVVDKLKGNSDEKKVDKLKSFFLKKLIIPKDKDRSLQESKRTGKVDYTHDPNRYFSYYLLHSLLVGVKSSFSLGFLLPG
jgi:hypothetical protein